VAEFSAFDPAPEVAESIAAVVWAVEIGDTGVAWRFTQPDELSVVADIDVALVVSGLEEEGIAVVTELSMSAP